MKNLSGTARNQQACKLNWNKNQHSAANQSSTSSPHPGPGESFWVVLQKFWGGAGGWSRRGAGSTGCAMGEQHCRARHFSSLQAAPAMVQVNVYTHGTSLSHLLLPYSRNPSTSFPKWQFQHSIFPLSLTPTFASMDMWGCLWCSSNNLIFWETEPRGKAGWKKDLLGCNKLCSLEKTCFNFR